MTNISLSNIETINFEVEDYATVFNLYKSDLQEYIDAVNGNDFKNNPYAQRFLLSKLEEKWKPILGFNLSSITHDIAQLQVPQTKFISSLGVREALSYYNEGASWVIPNLLRNSSMYILAGEPKAGKSMLVYFLIHSIAVSGSFLGRPTKTGKVLYLQLEESLETIGERFFMSGFGDINDESTQLVVNFMDRVRIEREFDIVTGMGHLRNLIAEFEPTLVVIDSLRAATLNSTASENTNEFGKLVYHLQQVFNSTSTCGLIIHHMNKASGNSNGSVISRVAGSGSIAAATSGIIALTSEETERGRVLTLKTVPRDGTPITIKYEMETNDDGLWKLHKLFEDTPLSHPVTSRILRYLADRVNEKFTFKQLAAGLQFSGNDANFRNCLKYLQANRLISSIYENKTFKYMLSSESLWLVNPENLRELLTPAALDANELLKCSNKQELRNLIQDWDGERRRLSVKELSSVEKTRITSLIVSWEFDIGDEVVYEGQIYTVEKQIGETGTLMQNKYQLSGLKEDINEQDLNRTVVQEESEPEEELELEDILESTEDDDPFCMDD